MATQSQQGNKNKKYGRNKAKCARYAANHKRERNKVRRIRRHLKQHPNDSQSFNRLQSWESRI